MVKIEIYHCQTVGRHLYHGGIKVKKGCLLLYLVYFTTPGNALAPQTEGKETGAVADSGHVRLWTKGKYIRVRDAPDHGKTVGPEGGDAAADGYHPTLPES